MLVLYTILAVPPSPPFKTGPTSSYAGNGKMKAIISGSKKEMNCGDPISNVLICDHFLFWRGNALF